MKLRQSRFRIFISYARPNVEAARELYARLKKARFAPWMDVEDLRAGEWEVLIGQALKDAQVVLVLLTKESITRDGFLQKEILKALEIWQNKAPDQGYLIPVRLEDCPIHKRLTSFHCFDLFSEVGWARLFNELKSQRKALRTQTPGATSDSTATPAPTTAMPARPKATVARLQSRHKRQLPVLAFPNAIETFLIRNDCSKVWSRLDKNMQLYMSTLSCKLEPIVQIIPARAIPVLLGFECLALGSGGQNFSEIIEDCKEIDPGLVRVCLAVAAIQHIGWMRMGATSGNVRSARKLLFSLNLDPIMLDTPLFKEFLRNYADSLEHNVIFEVNETTTARYLNQLKRLQADFRLRYAADDLNQWSDDVRAALEGRVELTKMDHASFKAAMDIRGDNAREAIKRLRAYKIRGKPLVVEGVQDPDYLMFLEHNWDYKKFGELYGQGYELDPGLHWDAEMLSLKQFGLPGGSALRRQG